MIKLQKILCHIYSDQWFDILHKNKLNVEKNKSLVFCTGGLMIETVHDITEISNDQTILFTSCL